MPIWASLIADASLASGKDCKEAETTVEQAVKISAATHELIVLADLLRLRGDIAVRRGDRELAQTSYTSAIAEAEKQGAHLYGLRAASGLAGLLRSEGKMDEAERVMAPILGRFSQNEHFFDLERARSLLGQ